MATLYTGLCSTFPYSAACQESKNCIIPELRSIEVHPGLVLYTFTLYDFGKEDIFSEPQVLYPSTFTRDEELHSSGFVLWNRLRCPEDGEKL